MAEAPGRITAYHDVIYPRYAPREFVGRQWLVKKVEQFRDSEAGRHLIIVGEPGSGKSTFMAYLAECWNCPRHFIRADNIGGVTGVDPRAFLLSMGAQLYQKYGREIFEQGNSTKTRVKVGLAKDQAEVVGRLVEELYTLPFLPQQQSEVQVQVVAATGESRVVGERVKRMIDVTLALEESTLLHVAVIQPLQRIEELYPDERVVLLVDALDESLQHLGKRILDVIPTATDPDFPGNLQLVMTSRPGDHLARFRKQDELRLDDRAAGYWKETLRDSRAYVDKRLSEEPLVSAMETMSQKKARTFIEEVETKSEGNFLYLFHFLNAAAEAVKKGETDLENITVPADLDEIYQFFAVGRIRKDPLDLIHFTVDRPVPEDLHAHWQAIEGVQRIAVAGREVTVMAEDSDPVLPRLFELTQAAGLRLSDLQTQRGTQLGTWEEKYLPLLGVLAVAFEALSRDQLAAFAEVEIEYVDSILAQLLQFLDTVKEGSAHGYRLYHRDFAEYLLDSSRNRDWPLDGQKYHCWIGSACLKRCRDQWDKCDTYCRRHASVHLAEADRWEAVGKLIEDPLFLLAADPGRLLGVINTGWGLLPQKIVRVYQQSVHHIRGNPLPEAASYLELIARQTKADELAGFVAQLNLRRPWSVRWVRWQYTSPHQVLTLHHRGVSGGQARVAVGKLNDRPVVVSAAGDIRVSDVESGNAIGAPIQGLSTRNFSVAVAEQEGRPIILSGGEDGIRMWELADGTAIGEVLPGYTGKILALAVGKLEERTVVVAGCADGNVRVWRLDERRLMREPIAGHEEAKVHAFMGASNEVRCVVVGELVDRPVIISGGYDKTIRIWDLAEGKPVGEPLTGHTGWVEAVTLTEWKDQPVIVSGGAFEEGVRIWDPVQGRQISTHPAVPEGFVGNSAIYALDVGEIEGQPIIVSSSYDGHIQFWNLPNGMPVGEPLTGHDGPVKSLVFTELRGRPVVVSAGDDSTVRAWHLEGVLSADESGVPQATEAYVLVVDEFEGRPVICTADSDWNLRILALATGELVYGPLPNPVQVHPDPIMGSLHAPFTFGLLQGQPVLIVFEQHGIGIWDPVEVQRIAAPIKVHFKEGGYVKLRLTLSKIEGRPVVLAGSSKGEVWIGDLLDRTQIAAWRDSEFSTIAMGKVDGQRLVATGEYCKESSIQLRNLANGQSEGRLITHHEGYISSIGLGKLDDRSVIVSGGSEGDLRVWNPDGELLSAVQLEAKIDDLAFGRGSTLVASTSRGIAVLEF
jgi:WD40 repeat protein